MERLARLRPCLAFVIVNITLAGYGFGTAVPIRTRIDEANRKFDAAEAVIVVACKDEGKDRRREQIEQKESLYDAALTAYRYIVNADPSGEYALRSLLKMSEIYKKRGEWDKVIDSYEAVLSIAPSGYYAERARSAIADSRKYRRLIEERLHRYRKYSALYAQDNIWSHRRNAAQALYDAANGYEQLGDYPTAIAYYQRVVDEFSDYRSAWHKIAEIYLHKLFDYGSGSSVCTKIIEMYPLSDLSSRIILLRRNAGIPLHNIRGCREIIDWLSQKNSKRYVVEGSLRDFDKDFFSDKASIVRAYEGIAQYYKELKNYPGAISTYRELADRYKFNAARAHHEICMLYARRGQIDQAIDAFQNLFDYSPESVDLADEIYQYAVRIRDHRLSTKAHAKAYGYFKIYINIGRGLKHHQEAERIIRQYERDEDGDGYKYYVEQDAGTSDQDPNDRPTE